jgi:asparagine synthase (glutamine-hydrolysing)
MMSHDISEVHDTPKYILKRAFEKTVSDKILYRKKMGFPVPLNTWLHGAWNAYAKSILLDKKTVDRGILNTDYIREALADERMKHHSFAMKIWMMINLEMFFRKYYK